MDLFIERDEVEVDEETPVMVDGVEADGVYDGVTVINICKLIDTIIPDYWTKLNYVWEETNKIITDWCEKNDVHYYDDVREEFFVWKGVDEAKENNKSVVVVEDLS